MRRIRSSTLLVILALCLGAALLIGLVVGPEIILPLAAVSSDAAISDRLIVTEIRLPRTLMAAAVGGILAVAGALMQGLFRNPLADPSLIGVTSGASAGASVAIVLFAGALGSQELAGLSVVALGAFVGAGAATLLVYRLAASDTGTSVATMLLAGIAISALAGAVSSFLEFISDNHMLRQISLWQMGSLTGTTWPLTMVAFAVLVLLMVISPRYANALNALLLGESEARHLGVDVTKLKLTIIGLVALVVGMSVAMTGTIAFVGLITPHIVRLLIGPDHRALIPCCALAGAVLLVLSDAVSRYVMAPSELPIGMVTAALGAPFFLSLLRQQKALMVSRHA